MTTDEKPDEPTAPRAGGECVPGGQDCPSDSRQGAMSAGDSPQQSNHEMSADDEPLMPDEPDGEASTESSVLPERAERFRRWLRAGTKTPVSAWLLSANIVMFAVMVLMSGPMTIYMPSQETLIKLGALSVTTTYGGQEWRMLSSMFLHFGLLHLLFNMYMLWYVGPAVERFFGSLKFLTIYMFAGLGGSISMLFWNPAEVGVGASGAIFGIFGGLLAFFQARKSDFPPGLFKSNMAALVIFLLFTLMVGFVQPNIANSAHLGGLVFGYVVAMAIMPREPEDIHWHWRDTMFMLLVVLAMGLLFEFERFQPVDVGGELSLLHAADLVDDRKYKEALPLLGKRIRLSPYDIRAYKARGTAYLALKDYRKAVDDCDRALKIDPRDFESLVKRSYAYEKLGEPQKAIDSLNRAIAVMPKETSRGIAFARRGWNHLVLGHYQAAIDDYSRGVALCPKQLTVYISLGYARFVTGDFKGATEDDRTFLASAGWKDENSPYAVIVSALSYRAMGKQTEADRMLDQGLVRLEPSAWAVRIVEYLRGKITAEKLESLAVDNDKMTEAKTYIGVVLAQAGNKEQARPDFEWVVRQGNKEFYEYVVARAELEKISTSMK